jgi:hypothetical protein
MKAECPKKMKDEEDPCVDSTVEFELSLLNAVRSFKSEF